MTRHEFISELDKNLKGLPEHEVKEILYDYQEHFNVGLSRGRTEAEIAASLGNPKQLAKEIKANFHITKLETSFTFSSLFQAVFATVGLGFFNLVIVLGPFLAVAGTLIGLLFSGVAVGVSGIFVIVVTFTNASFAHIPNTPTGVFLGLSLLAGGTLWTIGIAYLCKWFYILTVKYLKFNLNIITNRREKA